MYFSEPDDAGEYECVVNLHNGQSCNKTVHMFCKYPYSILLEDLGHLVIRILYSGSKGHGFDSCLEHSTSNIAPR